METENGEMEVRNAAVKLYGNLQGKLMGKFDWLSKSHLENVQEIGGYVRWQSWT